MSCAEDLESESKRGRAFQFPQMLYSANALKLRASRPPAAQGHEIAAYEQELGGAPAGKCQLQSAR